MAVFSDLNVGSRLTLRKRAGDMPAGTEVEVVKMLGPTDSTPQFPLKQEADGIAVKRVRDGASVGQEYEFVWACGRSYFLPHEKEDTDG